LDLEKGLWHQVTVGERDGVVESGDRDYKARRLGNQYMIVGFGDGCCGTRRLGDQDEVVIYGDRRLGDQDKVVRSVG